MIRNVFNLVCVKLLFEIINERERDDFFCNLFLYYLDIFD